MASSKLTPEFEIEVDGDLFVWHLHRQPQWSHDPSERHGKAISVRHKEGQREVVIEFPPGPRPKFNAPQLKPSQIPQRLITTAIASAMQAGWEPLSRGKTVFIFVNETGE
jgi:hypothetical protein